ncbi:hypothetical protein SAMIE_1024020 [Sphingobium amiense]|uniref:DUF3617 domain-containing protein n=2 Tax=Sphingobium amiense TaxID=135719 RepID=A0A494W3V6_9SPHN|nr:hypothetical protein SAMIE_1024020 [Sphingobium amiense]
MVQGTAGRGLNERDASQTELDRGMNKGFQQGLCALAILMASSAAYAAGAPAPALPSALQSLETGEWELRGRGEGAEVRKLCVTDLRQLLQVRHGKAQCRSFVISDAPHDMSVTYDCAAAGNGRTDLRVETSRLVQIRSQGVAEGAPFAFSAEGRRVGACKG